VIHSKPLPGSPSFTGESLDEIYTFAVEEGRQYADAGVDGLILENHGDIPFATPDEIGVETAATMAVMADRLRKTVGLPLGNQCARKRRHPRRRGRAGSGAGFVRVNQWANAYVANEGIIQGPAGRAARYRSWMRANQIKIFADVQREARGTCHRCRPEYHRTHGVTWSSSMRDVVIVDRSAHG